MAKPKKRRKADGASAGLSSSQQERILSKHTVHIHEVLNVTAALPHLIQHQLLTREERESLMLDAKTEQWKITYLLDTLPRKGKHALKKFIACLEGSAEGTGHKELAEELKRTLLTSITVDLKVCSRIAYHLNLYDSNLPHVTNINFFGREKELEDILSSLDFDNVTRLVTIVGSPGFGKSALALQAGHQLLRNGISVFYVDMQEAPNMLALAEKVLNSAQIYVQNVTVERMSRWAKTLGYESALILDNCDDVLDEYQDNFQDVIEKSLASSQKLKIITTSRIKKIYLEYSSHIVLPPLPTADACRLLESFVRTLDQSEKEKIVELTGSVPLALRVVASILRGPDSPGPQVIIQKLSDELIKTLSPEDLSTNNRVNASIYLSYKHLTNVTQKAGCYLANFPATFDGITACRVHSIAHPVENCIHILKSLQQRSLLEQNQLTKRYHFHPLIRQFFLEMQKLQEINITQFSHAFIQVYKEILIDIAESTGNYALNVFDTEGINIFHMLLMVSNPSKEVKEYTISLVYAMKAVCNFRVFELLQGHFSLDELCDLFKNIGNFLQDIASQGIISTHEITLWNFGSRHQFKSDLFSTYVLQTNHLSVLIYRKFGQEKVYDLILKQKQWVERMYIGVSSKDSKVLYLKFYRNCVSLVTNLTSSLYKECHEKILKATGDLKDCFPDNNCEYASIGLAYHAIGKANEAKIFLQLAIDHQSGIALIKQVNILIILSDLHLMDGNTEESDRLAKKAVELFPNIMKESSVTDLQQYRAEMQDIVSFYRTHGNYHEALLLENKQIEISKSFKKNMKKNDFINLLKLAQSFYQGGNYSETLKVITVALDGHKHLPRRDAGDVQFIYIKMQILAGITEIYVGNLSSGVHHLTSVIGYIQEYDGTHLYANEFNEACINLAIRGGQLHPCLRGTIVDAAMFIFHFIFRSEFLFHEGSSVENTDDDEMLFQDLVLSTALSVPESHVTIINQLQFGLHHYFNGFVSLLKKYSVLCVNFFYNLFLFIISFAFVYTLLNLCFILVKLFVCVTITFNCCCFCYCICRWIKRFILFLFFQLYYY